jgi:hypothetical protein
MQQNQVKAKKVAAFFAIFAKSVSGLVNSHSVNKRY